ncbi:LysR family transcriptional regulator [Peribacillus asahii]|uniref:LysR family transcriptional regulator n=1 Tax=Peribacillus asahii TaxID=228899 RepID=A0A398B130_9BACI|nr:LysR family transcriptional regulator [Peribacillus asahii]RID81593.1 LysR family transcriptional regulator [Peribacillus asahii]
MDIKWIKTFIVAAQYENFRQASEELFVTQPAITKHIKRLEEQLNSQLFERVGKHVTLTAAGHRFLPYAREILAQYEQGLDEFEAWKQGYKRKLSIATAPQIASSVLPSLLRSFMNQYPDIEVLIDVLKSYEIGEEISAGRADIGLTRVKPIQMNIYCQMVHEEPVILVGPNDVNLDEKTGLHTYRLITHNHPDYWDDLLHDVKRVYPIVRTMAVNQVEITKKFIEQGLGISYLPRSMVKEEISMGKLLEVKSNQISPPASATYILTKVETDEVRAFSQFLREEIVDF